MPPEVGIAGSAQSGKTTVFCALTGQDFDALSRHPGARAGVAKIPDSRLDLLSSILHPEKVTPAEVKFLDFGPGGRASSGAEGLLLVVRAFDELDISRMKGELADLEGEFLLHDLEIIERRVEKLSKIARSGKPKEREAASSELYVLERIKRDLAAEIPIRSQELSEPERKLLRGYELLTAKPLLILLNINERDIDKAEEIEREFGDWSSKPRTEVAAFPAKLEMELAQLGEEGREMRRSLGLPDFRERALKALLKALDLITFFTVVSDEVRAWLVPRGTSAQRAAGKIHSDMERGFIKAEVLGVEELGECGSLSEARRRGLLRSEGRNYQVRDGDILTILFGR